MAAEEFTPDARGEQTRKQGRTERSGAADQRQRDGVERAQHRRAGAHVVQHELDGRETHGNPGPDDERDRGDDPERRGQTVAQKDIAYW